MSEFLVWFSQRNVNGDVALDGRIALVVSDAIIKNGFPNDWHAMNYLQP